MSLQSFHVGNDLREQVQHRSRQGHKAGLKFVRQNKTKDKIWLGGFLNEVEKQVQQLDVPKAVEDLGRDVDKGLENNPLQSGVEGMQKMIDPSSWATDFLKGNLPKAAVRASFSCAVFHEVKERLVKPEARRARWKHAEPVTCYVCDVILPTPLYGPFFVFLVGKAREYVVGQALSIVGLNSDD